MNNRQRILALLPWYSLGVLLIGVGTLFGVICQMSLKLVGLYPLWYAFILGGMICFIKGCADARFFEPAPD